jgi:hypothetical protein
LLSCIVAGVTLSLFNHKCRWLSRPRPPQPASSFIPNIGHEILDRARARKFLICVAASCACFLKCKCKWNLTLHGIDSMKKFVIWLTLNMAVFISIMTYGQSWFYRNGAYSELLALLIIAAIIQLLNHTIFRKNYPETFNKHDFGILVGVMSGQVIGISLLWLIGRLLS